MGDAVRRDLFLKARCEQNICTVANRGSGFLYQGTGLISGPNRFLIFSYTDSSSSEMPDVG